MAAKKQHTAGLYVIGKNNQSQLGLHPSKESNRRKSPFCDFRPSTAIDQLTLWSPASLVDTDPVEITARQMQVQTGSEFTLLCPENSGNILLTFGYIREQLQYLAVGTNRMPVALVELCAAYIREDRIFAAGSMYFVGLLHDLKSCTDLYDIRVVSVHANFCSSFFISADHSVYCAGRDDFNQLCPSAPHDQHDERHVMEPTRIEALDGKGIVDIQPGECHSLALSRNGDVYASGYVLGCGHGDAIVSGWNRISFFASRSIKIKQIAAGCDFSVFLDCDGVVYSCGDDASCGRLGLFPRQAEADVPTVLTVLKKRKIVKIAAGGHHALALDSESTVYAWGRNEQGECGSYTAEKFNVCPMSIDVDSQSSIVDIACGGRHSLIKTQAGEHFLFGCNKFNQVGLTHERKMLRCIATPTPIDDIFTEMGLYVERIALGNGTTWIWTRPITQHEIHRQPTAMGSVQNVMKGDESFLDERRREVFAFDRDCN